MACANRKIPRNQGSRRREAIWGCGARGRGLYTAWTGKGWARKDKRQSRLAPLADDQVTKKLRRASILLGIRPSKFWFMPKRVIAISKRELSQRLLARFLLALAASLLGFFPGVFSKDASLAEAKEQNARAAKGQSEKIEKGCRVQKPQVFLERRSFVIGGMLDGAKQLKAVRYLSEHYGHVDEQITSQWNKQSAFSQAKSATFFGLPILIHKKVAPALACVEKEIRKTCTGKSSYSPRAIGGFRGENTYRGGEFSHHLFGTAIDIDPERNPCCGCVDPWPNHRYCKDKSRKDVYERMDMPKCWIKAFERYGFSWLGRDKLEDSMHFEFLGDPEPKGKTQKKPAKTPKKPSKPKAKKKAAQP